MAKGKNSKKETRKNLLIYDAVNKKDADAIFGEMNTFEWDTKYWDTRRSKVLNKHARSNVCFDSFSQEPGSTKLHNPMAYKSLKQLAAKK